MFLFFLNLGVAQAAVNQPVHFSGDKQIWNRKENRVELIGHAAVSQLGETLTADYITLDMNTRILDARGNCLYISEGSAIYGEEMHFNLDTRTGTVIDGRIANDKFTLSGERINKLGQGRFQTHWGSYTTCRDCAASWTLLAQDVDMEVDGYAYLSNVTTKIKDAPTFWLPYLIVPMKTRRQTGFLFPVFSFGSINGTTVVLPFFWAINRSSDMTIAAGEYTERGPRLEWEGRYALSPRSGAKANFYYLRDRSFIRENRWSLNITQTHEFPWGIEEKFKFSEVSDNIYPFIFSQDIPSVANEAFLPSSLLFTRGSTDVSAFVSFQRYRNLLNSNTVDPAAYPDPNDFQAAQTNLRATQFDPRTVQSYPTIVVTSNDRFLWGTPIAAGLTLGFNNFTRDAGTFDYDQSSTGVPFGSPLSPSILEKPYTPGVDPIRKAIRFSLTPTIYTTLRPFDVVSVVPSLQYRGYLYSFRNLVPNLYRSYVLFQLDLSTQLERIYEFPDTPNTPRAKHLIRPLLTYSYIPLVRQDDNHPFIKQIQYAQTAYAGQNFTPGYNFDDNDIVPINYSANSTQYFTPLGNSLAYGFVTQWIERRGSVQSEIPGYRNTVEFTAGQAINFKELSTPIDPNRPQILTRLFSTLNFNFDKFSSGTTYYYYPDRLDPSSRNVISTSATYIFERATHEKILLFDRSVTLGYNYTKIGQPVNNLTGSFNYSISDYLQPTGSISYSFVTSQLLGAGGGLLIQSPSRCWKFSVGGTFASGVGPQVSFDLSLNLTGTGFGGVTEIANQAQTH